MDILSEDPSTYQFFVEHESYAYVAKIKYSG